MFLISSFKAVVLVGIFGRLASLQINESSKYKSLADKNRFRESKIAPPRGAIQDYFGKEIVHPPLFEYEMGLEARIATFFEIWKLF